MSRIRWPLRIRNCFFLYLFLFCGCVRIPESEQAVPETCSEVSGAVKEAIQEGSFEAGEWIEQKWWERFDDLVLTGLIEQGIRSSPSLSLARERLKAAAQV